MTAFARTSCILLIALLVGHSQASFEEKLLDFVHGMAEKVEDEMKELKNEVGSVKDKVYNKMEELKSEIDNKRQEKLSFALRKASNMQCQPNIYTKLDSVYESPTDRFLACINFTDSITQLEKYIFSLGNQMTKIEDLVCQSLQNVTSCSGNVLMKIACYSGEVTDFIESVKTQSSVVLSIYQALVGYGDEIIDHFIKCFTTINYEIESNFNAMLETHCH